MQQVLQFPPAPQPQDDWTSNFMRWLRPVLEAIRQQVNTQVQQLGESIASARTITVTSAIHHVTGTTAIHRINPPTGFTGDVRLIPDAAFTLGTGDGGNIAKASTAVVGRTLVVTYDGTNWYPSY